MSEDFASRLQSQIAAMPKTMRRVAQYFAQSPLDVVSRSAGQLGELLGTSDATVVRTAQALGYDGLSELKRAMAASLASPTPADGFRQTVTAAEANVRRALVRSLGTQARAVGALGDDAGLDMIEAIGIRLNTCRRVVMFGQGPTSHIVAYGAQLLRRHGREVHLLHAGGTALADELLLLRDGDGLLVLAYGPAYVEVSASMAEALALGLPIVLVTDRSKGPLASQADLVAVVPRGESNGMATHGATLVWLEALIATMAMLDRGRTEESLRRLERLRQPLGLPRKG